MVRLLNSAIIVADGIYEAKKISFEEFCKILVDAHKKSDLKSYIGYPQNVELIKKWTGVEVELNRSQTDIKDGDILLVMKLKYRVVNPSDKGKEVDESDFEFMRIKYFK